MRRSNNRGLDALLRSISDRRRRHVLAYLREAEHGSATVGELVEYVVDREGHSSSVIRDAVALSMYRSHLPLLADTGLVDYDGERSSVTRMDRADLSDPFLELARSQERSTETATKDR